MRNEPFEISISVNNERGVLIIKVFGNCLNNAAGENPLRPDLLSEVISIAKLTSQGAVVDLMEVGVIDTAAIGALIDAANNLGKIDRRLALVLDRTKESLPNSIQQTIKDAKLERALPYYPSQQEAIASFQG